MTCWTTWMTMAANQKTASRTAKEGESLCSLLAAPSIA
jgi:hypothetical protein